MAQARYVLAWHCPSPPRLEEFAWSPGQNPDDYYGTVDYIRTHAVAVSWREFFRQVGGKREVMRGLWAGNTDYPITRDHHIGWYRSQYPDGTSIYFHTHSGIEHVYEPAGYRR